MSLIVKETLMGTIYQCSCCGQEYKELPMTFGSDVPDYYYSIPTEEREKRIELAESLCIIDEKYFFHRGRLVIPIVDSTQNLTFNVWTSISESNFRKRNELWNDPARVNEEPYFGWLQTIIPTYDDTSETATIAIENEVGLIPTIRVIKAGHSLQMDQENGISYEKALQIVSYIITKTHKA